MKKDGSLIEVSAHRFPIRDGQGRIIGASKILRMSQTGSAWNDLLCRQKKLRLPEGWLPRSRMRLTTPSSRLRTCCICFAQRVIDEDGLNYLSTAESELSRVSHIAKQTLGYYREHAAATKASLSEVAQHAVNIYTPRCIAAGIAITTSFQSSRKSTLRRGEMMQVISNLIANSIYAMPTGGHLSIVVQDTDEPVSGTILLISDDGVGIASRDLPKVTEAFFTTAPRLAQGLVCLWPSSSSRDTGARSALRARWMR